MISDTNPVLIAKALDEAAAAVGYKDVTYFSATFKKLTGLSPSEVE